MNDEDGAGREPQAGWAGLPTEARHPASRGLDALASAAIVELLLAEDGRGLEAASRHGDAIARAADWIAATLESGGDVVFAGAGTSGRLGILEAAECPPTFGTRPERIRGVIAGGEGAVSRAVEGAEDDAEAGRSDVATLTARDLAIGISASAVTPYVRGALEAARRTGARTVLLTCAAPSGLEDLADLVVALDTGPEILTGSTRLKAGSATKAALNAMTTAAMARLGKIYDNLMVDLRPGSAKLEDRARRILEAAGGGTRSAEILAAAGGELKTAIVMVRCAVPAAAARRHLAAANGHVRKAIALGRSAGGGHDPDAEPG